MAATTIPLHNINCKVRSALPAMSKPFDVCHSFHQPDEVTHTPSICSYRVLRPVASCSIILIHNVTSRSSYIPLTCKLTRSTHTHEFVVAVVSQTNVDVFVRRHGGARSDRCDQNKCAPHAALTDSIICIPQSNNRTLTERLANQKMERRSAQRCHRIYVAETINNLTNGDPSLKSLY